mgnify:FL=1
MLDLQPILEKKSRELHVLADEILKPRSIEHSPPFSFNTNDLKQDESPKIISAVQEWAGDNKKLYIYYFSLKGDVDLERLVAAFTEAKEYKERTRAYPRFNAKSKYLYVGSSKEIDKRFKEHLGYGHKGTYAMQLGHWANGLNLNVDFMCMRFETTTTGKVLQAFEDAIWDNFNPMLGRRGAK